MGRQFDDINDRLRGWVEQQPIFFVATAPNDPDGHVNVSPKGAKETFAILGPTTVAYVDLIGSGIETVAHLRENGRIVMMFCAFTGAPKIFRFHGRGRVIEQESAEFPDLIAHFTLSEDVLAIARTIIVVEISRISDSCGFVVPRMDFVEERDQLPKWAKHQHSEFGAAWKADYLESNNQQSLDGLPGLDTHDRLSDSERAHHSSEGRAL